MTECVAAQRRGRLARLLAVCLLGGVAAGGVVWGPRLGEAVAKGGGVIAASRRKLGALRDFALFRSRGDKAVLRFGDPPSPRAVPKERPRTTRIRP
jgi:hypothetical protein